MGQPNRERLAHFCHPHLFPDQQQTRNPPQTQFNQSHGCLGKLEPNQNEQLIHLIPLLNNHHQIFKSFKFFKSQIKNQKSQIKNQKSQITNLE